MVVNFEILEGIFLSDFLLLTVNYSSTKLFNMKSNRQGKHYDEKISKISLSYKNLYDSEIGSDETLSHSGDSITSST